MCGCPTQQGHFPVSDCRKRNEKITGIPRKEQQKTKLHRSIHNEQADDTKNESC